MRDRSFPAAVLAAILFTLPGAAQAEPEPGAPVGPCADIVAEWEATVRGASLPAPGRISGILGTHRPLFYTGGALAQGPASDRLLRGQAKALAAAAHLAPIPIPVAEVRARPDSVFLIGTLRAALAQIPGGRSRCTVSAFTRDWNVQNWSAALRELMAPFQPPPRPKNPAGAE